MDIMYLPNNSGDAFEFNNKIMEVLVAEEKENLLDMALKLIPTYWIGYGIGKFIDDKNWKNHFFSIYNNLEINGVYCREVSPNIIIEIYNHKYCKELQRQYEIDFWEQDFLSPVISRKMYFLHPVYGMYVFLDDYYQSIFSEKFYFWKKILIELGAKSIILKNYDNSFSKIYNHFGFDIPFNSNFSFSDREGYTKSKSKNTQEFSKETIFLQPDNFPNKEFLDSNSDDFFNEDGEYLFPNEKNEIESFKKYAWTYHDDREFRQIFETRIRQIQANKISKLDFDISCQFDKFALNQRDEELMLKLGFLKKTFIEVEKSRIVLNLKVSF
jgi:hypothetical protein